MAGPNYDEAIEFENEVLRVARLLYPGDPYSGPTISGGSERDAVIVTDDLVVIIEATTSQMKEKAEKDGKKLRQLADEVARRYPFKGVKAFFITRSAPTAHQADVIRKFGQPLAAQSFADFKARLIDSRAYMDARGDYAFGSARDPETDGIAVKDSYVPLDFVDATNRSTQYSTPDLLLGVEQYRRVVLIGDFGTGKSMTLREIYMRLRASHLKSPATNAFAIHLNLSDHKGQSEPSEALIRHAQLIGFTQPTQLIRAWRSGAAHIILDGFDEIVGASTGTASRQISDVRRQSVELVRRFVAESPQMSGVLVAGREHYFDSTRELMSALGLPKTALVASASEFTEEQVQLYLKNRAWTQALPYWLPRRPLLIGYLAGRRLFDLVEDVDAMDAGSGWYRLIDAISEREARADVGVDAAMIREMLEKLGTLARKTASGSGPLQFQDLVTVFQDLRGYLPDEGAYSLLQRLPGLRVVDGQTNARTFVDDTFVDAVRAGDVYRWITNPHRTDIVEAFGGAQTLLGTIGLSVVQYQLEVGNISEGTLTTALSKSQDNQYGSVLAADLLRIALSRGDKLKRPVHVSGLVLPSLEIAERGDASTVTFTDCIIQSLDLTEHPPIEFLPAFYDSTIDLIEGIAAFDELSGERFIGTTIVAFGESTQNAAAILRLNMPDDRRVMLTILRKAFVQSGHSRKESAFFRGSLSARQKALIPEALEALKSRGAVRRIRRRDATLWEPNRSLYTRVMRVLDEPSSSTDPLIASLP